MTCLYQVTFNKDKRCIYSKLCQMALLDSSKQLFRSVYYIGFAKVSSLSTWWSLSYCITSFFLTSFFVPLWRPLLPYLLSHIIIIIIIMNERTPSSCNFFLLPLGLSLANHSHSVYMYISFLFSVVDFLSVSCNSFG